MGSELIVRLNQGCAQVCNGPAAFTVSGRNSSTAGVVCPTEMIGAALGS
jgi:hypothetical protein